MVIDVGQWDYQAMAESVGIEEKGVKGRKPKAEESDWKKAFEDYLVENSGIQQIGEFMEFELYRDVTFTSDQEVPADDPAILQKVVAAGYEIYKRPDGFVYALARAGQTYKLPMKYKIPVTFAGALPGHNVVRKKGDETVQGFDWEGFGIADRRDLKSKNHAAQIAKMATAQILMTVGGFSPAELQEKFGPENMGVSFGTGLGDLLPFNEMTVSPLMETDSAYPGLLAALLPDAASGQVATEVLGAMRMALAPVAACSTGNASIIMAVSQLFSDYYMATRDQLDWPEVFAKMWVAGGADYAVTFNAFFSFKYQ